MYIHKQPIRVHGRLNSEACLIDSRFSVKVAYYGLPTIYDRIQLASKQQSNEKDLLWKAPEVLRPGGIATPEADVYSLGIVISELLTRDEPYSQDKEYLTIEGVLAKIRDGHDPPFRPAVAAPPEMVAIETLMRQCWDENPSSRPPLNKIFNILQGLMMKVNKSGSLVDNLLQRLEKYSTNLEKIVDEKVEELRQEKQKSEELLKQMLPASVADRLKAGLTVEPEFYDCVTIYFSDIVGFTVICSQLKPVQIINLLNDLYSCFDGIIDFYDVYKVETIGDGYMVVSGLPNRNGNEHARQIARMSLALLKVISEFTPVETSESRLKLRIGLHSGPVCAGVVGLKMPRYCLFGDSVNTASRMESNGVELKIHMSGSTAGILETFGNFQIQSRGHIEVKGKGTMETFWLLGEKGP
ncbi:atrial natriuretic peptide receptor 2-like [Physella acuta]|uniref:atrial natriuretic peptide receptor 2-like n=1 Tax=Physella acuta TaxID=109671 RepID=UPI0027DABA6B|nr:atrial natriuretic peptide receptor 2-like [Physella acuta]